MYEYVKDGRVLYGVPEVDTLCNKCAFDENGQTGDEREFRGEACEANIDICNDKEIYFKERLDIGIADCYIKITGIECFLHKDGDYFTLYNEDKRLFTVGAAFDKVDAMNEEFNKSPMMDVCKSKTSHEVACRPIPPFN